MKRAVRLLVLLTLGLFWTLKAVPVQPEPLIATHESFNVSQTPHPEMWSQWKCYRLVEAETDEDQICLVLFAHFMGRWYEVAVVSTCPHYMKRKRESSAVVAVDMRHIPSEENFSMTSTSFRNGSCKQAATDYSLTDTPGRFFHHVSRFDADVDSFVVHTNYDDFAMILQLSTEKPSGIETTTVKLYSRAMNVSSAVLDDFKSLVRRHGMREEDVIINQSKGTEGECV